MSLTPISIVEQNKTVLLIKNGSLDLKHTILQITGELTNDKSHLQGIMVFNLSKWISSPRINTTPKIPGRRISLKELGNALLKRHL